MATVRSRRVTGFVDLTHAASPDRSADLVRAELRPCLKRHRSL